MSYLQTARASLADRS